jgi:predicted lipid-binding transport protein (Tim44 family)
LNAEMDLDIIELLRDEHEDLRELFDEVLSAEPQARTEPFRYLVSRLAAHEAAEEALVHNISQKEIPGGDEPAEIALAQEASAERMLAGMEDMEPSSDEFVEALQELQQAVLEHAAHEERDEFPLLTEHLTITRRRELAEAFQVLRDGGPTRPHPMTPQSPTVRALTGPVVGIFDRARDTVRDALGR